MWRAEEFVQDEMRADYYQDRAQMDAAMGNFGQAAIDEARSEMSRIEAVSDITNPYPSPFGHHHHHHNRLEGEIVAAEMAAADMQMMERERLREMEMAGGGMMPGVAPYGAPGVGYGVPPAGYPGGYPQTYPPTYPQQGYPGAGYPGAPGYRPY